MLLFYVRIYLKIYRIYEFLKNFCMYVVSVYLRMYFVGFDNRLFIYDFELNCCNLSFYLFEGWI